MSGRGLLQFHTPSRDYSGFLILIENDGTPVITYNTTAGSFATVEHAGRKFRIAGQDKQTGELIYVPEVELI